MTAALGLTCSREGAWGVVRLDRQDALNALSHDMVRELSTHLRRWRDDPGVRAVLVEAAPGRAFCAGGDVRRIAEIGRSEGVDAACRFYHDEYRMNWRIHHFPKPYVALVDGIVMGGGVGISVHGTYRVVSEKVLFAMPETGIGFFPDVGGTYVLPRCPGELGLHLGLSGTRLGAADSLYAGIATHFVPSERIAGLRRALLADDLAGDPFAAVDGVLAAEEGDPGPPALAARQAWIDRCYGQGTLEEVVRALEEDRSEPASQLLPVLRRHAPFSLRVTFHQLRTGGRLDFDSAMRLEYRMVHRFMAGHDFYEGVRALLVDKDRRPAWQPGRLEEVETADVLACFAPLPEGDLAFDWDRDV